METFWVETSTAINPEHPHILLTATVQDCTKIIEPKGLLIEDTD